MRPFLWPRGLRRLGRVTLLAIALPRFVYGWDQHAHITSAAVETVRLVHETVTFVPLPQAIAALEADFKDVSGLLVHYKLNKNTNFKNALQETESAPVEAKAVVSHYADEPDWGTDQNLFEVDQYPELWNDEMVYVSKKRGLGSQGFRHMYFPGKWTWKEPIASIQIPQKPLGEAPQRAIMFLDLSKRFFSKGQSYWGYRFLAWSLHFIQDMHQPFHVRQTPSKKFMRFQWKGWLPGLDVPGTTEQIVYYHLSYERWMADQMNRKEGELRRALKARATLAEPMPPLEPYLLKEVVDFSSAFASEVGIGCHEAFPSYTPKPEVPTDEYVASQQWLDAVKSNKNLVGLFTVTEKLFSHMGEFTRRWIRNAESAIATK